MKISESWLREWVNPNITVAELAEQLTMAGLEIDGVEALGGELKGVVVAEIVSAEPHPDAEKLRVCQVETGDGQVQIVCGAPNARVGLKAPLATIGAVLPPTEPGAKPFKIKKAKLRGVESQGMLCAEQELGLGESNDGLWELAAEAPVGCSLLDYLALPDAVLEIDLTPNRSDCLSLAGVAREVGVLNRLGVNEVEVLAVSHSIDDIFSVKLESAEDCPRFVNRVIRGVDLSKPSPLWMQQRLQRSGVRSIDAAVDVTNYVMLELGQPMHAFDLAELSGSIRVRLAEQGESLTLLDGSELALDASSLLIADEEKALALAGIMGGKHSGVKAETTDLMLEAAHFTPAKIAGRARKYGLHTDASHRFERGVDPELPRKAIERATALLLSIVGGDAGPVNEACEEAALPTRSPIALRRKQIKRLLGFEMPDADVLETMERLGFAVSSNDDGWLVTPTSARFDIEIEADLLEELARIYGYNRLPVSKLSHAAALSPSDEAKGSLSRLRRQLIAADYQEAVCYSFIDPALQATFDPEAPVVELRNPISSEMSVMRTSLLPGLLTAMQHNLNRQHHRVRLFETGQRFAPQEAELAQTEMLAAISCGNRFSERWSHDKSASDFYDIKGDLENILGLFGRGGDYAVTAGEHPAMHPGQCAQVCKGNRVVGHVGALHPRLAAELELPANVLMFEIELQVVLQGQLPSYQKVSKFPEVRRDLAILISDEFSVAEVMSHVRQSAGSILTDLKVFDVYAGKGVEDGKKSVGLGLTFQDHSRTLADEDVSSSLGQVVAQLEQEFGATLRN